MCGIFGHYNRAGETLPDELLRNMGACIVHRGPDHHGLFSAPGVALGSQRLSILDVEHGNQPFVSDDGQIVVVQNGEIFNYVELAQELAQDGYTCRTRSDTEVLLRLYERDGIGFLPRLNGMFAIAIYDAREERLYLIRDRIGVKPLYLYDDGEQVFFASEIKALLKAGVPRRVNLQALQDYLVFNFVPPPHTMFDGVRHLEPGHYLTIDRRETSAARWWDLSRMEPEERSEAEWIDLFNETLDDAVRLRLRSDVPFGAFLSGGVDSSTVVGLMARHMNRPVDTFTIGFHESRFDESAYAQEAADRFGTEHTMERVSPDMLDLWPHAIYHCDQPHGDVSFLPTYRVSELAARKVKVVLTGDGGDELFAGYDKYRQLFSSPEASSWDDVAFRQAYAHNISLFTTERRQELFAPGLASSLEGRDPYEALGPMFDQAGHMDRINQALYLDMMLLLPGNNLVKPDRMGMSVSLEARTPFLDYRMMELAFSMPGHLKLRDGETKYLYKKAAAPLIGEPLAYRKKQMFTVPVGEWFKKDAEGVFAEFLLSERSLSRSWFDAATVRTMLGDHQEERHNYTREIRALIALELWMRIFMEDDAGVTPHAGKLGFPRMSSLSAPG